MTDKRDSAAAEKTTSAARQTAHLNFARLGDGYSVRSCDIRDLTTSELLNSDGILDQVSQAITHVNGEEVQRPYFGFKEWNSKTFVLLKAALDAFSFTPDSVVSDFLSEAGLPLPPELAKRS